MDTRKRIIAKTITFKILAMTTGFFTALFFTGSKETALFVTIANSITTLIGFYIHEQVWTKLNWAIVQDKDTHKRTLVKTITYKTWIFTVGTLTKWAVIGNFTTALSVGITKNLITTIIYYLHDRIWNKVSWGIKSD